MESHLLLIPLHICDNISLQLFLQTDGGSCFDCLSCYISGYIVSHGAVGSPQTFPPHLPPKCVNLVPVT